MTSIIKSNKDVLAKCYLVILSISALLFKALVYHCTYSLEGDEWILFSKMTPWTLSPMFICTLLGAYFTDKGYGKEVGIIGLFLLLAAAITLSGSMLWASSYRDTDELGTVLSGYPIRMSLAVFLVASSFMQGASIVLLLWLLKSVRNSSAAKAEGISLAISAVFTCILAILMLIVRPQLTWPVIALGGALIVIMTIPAFFCFRSLETSLDVVNEAAVKMDADSNISTWVLPVVTLALCQIIIVTYWHYLPISWQYYHIGIRRLYYMAIIISSIAFVVGLLFYRKTCKGTVLVGGILMLFGLPLGAMLMDEAVLLEIIPMALIGEGMAMIIGATIESFVKVPVKHYALTYVGIIAAIVVFSKLMIVGFNRMEVAFHTRTVAIYIVFPLLAVAVMVLGYLLRDKNEKGGFHVV
jgi:hypothetical protein